MSSLSILLVDDDDMILMLHEHILKRELFINGHVPSIARDGQEAIQALMENDNPDTTFLVFLDINMPVMDGWEFMEELVESNLRSNVLVSIVTSSLDYSDKQRAEKYNQILSYIEKPLNRNNLEKLKEAPELTHFFS